MGINPTFNAPLMLAALGAKTTRDSGTPQIQPSSNVGNMPPNVNTGTPQVLKTPEESGGTLGSKPVIKQEVVDEDYEDVPHTKKRGRKPKKKVGEKVEESKKSSENPPPTTKHGDSKEDVDMTKKSRMKTGKQDDDNEEHLIMAKKGKTEPQTATQDDETPVSEARSVETFTLV